MPKDITGLKPFKKGYDPRRNLKGVPRDAIEARKMIRKIGAELLTIKEKNEAGEVIEYELTRYEAMVRLMYSSRNPAEKIALLKALSPGLLKDELDLSGNTKVELIVKYATDNKPTEAAPKAD